MSVNDAQANPRKPTIRTVAGRAGVSLKTVSRVINNEPAVLPATRARVLLEGGGITKDPLPRFDALRALGAISASVPTRSCICGCPSAPPSTRRSSWRRRSTTGDR